MGKSIEEAGKQHSTLVTVKIKPVAVSAFFSDEYIQGCDHCATSGWMLSTVSY